MLIINLTQCVTDDVVKLFVREVARACFVHLQSAQHLRPRIIASLFVIALVVAAIPFWLIPNSVQVYMAGIATCNISDRDLGTDDPLFKKSRSWEWGFARLYRFKQWYFGGPSNLANLNGGSLSPLHALIDASSNTAGRCDAEIVSLFHRYIELGVPLDSYDSVGLTALQESVVMHKSAFIQLLIQSGANMNLPVKHPGSPIDGMTASGMAIFFNSRTKDDRWKPVLRALKLET